METRSYRLAVGSFAIFLILGTLAFVLWFSKFEFTDDNRTYMIHFKGSVNGLRVNESVRFHGIPIGLVKKIFVDPQDISTVKVKVVIDRPNLIREDSIASIEAQGLTGFTYVQIIGGSSDKPPLHKHKGFKYPIIRSKQSNIEALFSSAPQILDKLYELTGRVNHLMSDENLKNLGESLKGISGLIQNLSHNSSSITQFLNKDLGLVIKDIQSTIAIFQSTTSLFKGILEENQKPILRFSQKGLTNIHQLACELRQSNQKLQKILDQLEVSPLQFLKKNQPQGVPVP